MIIVEVSTRVHAGTVAIVGAVCVVAILALMARRVARMPMTSVHAEEEARAA